MMLRELHIVTAVLLALTGLCAAASPVAAQSTSRMAVYAQVSKACVTETQRLCPGLDPTISQPRNQAICLKPFRNSLSLSCRRAVVAVSP